MLATFEALIVDLFFILLIALLTELLFDTKKIPPKYHLPIYILTYFVALFFNMVFNVKFDGKFQIDLRVLVFVLAGLYVGFRCLVPLLIISLIYIGFVYPGEFMANVVTLGISSMAIWGLSLHFSSWRLRKKLLLPGATTIFTGLVIMKTVAYFYDFTTGYDSFIVAIYGGSIIIMIYSMEWVRNSIALKNRVQQSEKLELVSHLAASISHEIRNPLTVTRGFLQILEKEDFSTEKKKEYFTLAKSELDRAEGIISDYLTFAKPLSSKIELLALDLELKNVAEIISPLANMNSVSILINVEGFQILGEKQLFLQCILNIMKNAIEAMETGGGTLLVATKDIGSSVRIEISDTGIGMSPDQIDRLGEPYFSTRGKNGTGLGMMVVYSIVGSMNGSIQVKSKPGEGSTFMLTFPKAHALKAAE